MPHLHAQFCQVFLFPFRLTPLVFFPYLSMFSLAHRLIFFMFRFFVFIQLPSIFLNLLLIIVFIAPSLARLNLSLPLRFDLIVSFHILAYSIPTACFLLLFLYLTFLVFLLLLAHVIFSDVLFLLLILISPYFLQYLVSFLLLISLYSSFSHAQFVLLLLTILDLS